MSENKTQKRGTKGEGSYRINKDKTVTNRISYIDENGKRQFISFRGKNKTEARNMRLQWEQDHANKNTLKYYLLLQ
jgi:hypothetical protein